ncbi:hypothetical protein ACHAWO_006557 [Cyclotella atomus]|uniref:Uncharacterized protein n=1 Tax=Cyclotella atomus TaxID=382360 RepID=A0ABD3N3P0_9STRA
MESTTPNIDLAERSQGHVKPRIQEIEQQVQSRAAKMDTSSDELVVYQDNHHISALAGASSLKQFESEALKRQAEHSSRISDLEGRLALFHARLAKESAERGREHAATMDECINGPLEGVMKRALGKLEGEFVRTFMDPARANGQPQVNEEGKEEKKDSDSEKLHNLVSIERRINLLEAQMNHHQHITLFHSQKRNFDSIQQQARTMLEPALTLESTKADKREGALVRRFEASAGEYTRLLAEVEASRASSLGIVKKEIDSWKIENRAEHFLSEIRQLKVMITKESDERKKQDELVLNRVNKKFERVKAEMLAIAG